MTATLPASPELTLEPCPFCGAVPKLVEENLDGPACWSIACDNDDCASRPTLVHTDKHDAIAAWNTRHRSSPSSAWRDISEGEFEHGDRADIWGEGRRWPECSLLGDAWWFGQGSDPAHRVHNPTHYMPLPEPPK